MKSFISIVTLLLFFSFALFSQKYKEQNLPTVDFKRLHFGFSVGLHTQNILFDHIDQTALNKQWYAEIPSYTPGFSVGLVSDLSLSRYFNLRFVPSLHFGSKDVSFKKWGSDSLLTQNLKSNYLLLPLELKYSSLRFNNSRPYLMLGGALGFDLSRKQGDTELIRLNPLDFYVEIGVGCDLYFNYFKLNPELKFCFGLSNVLDKTRRDMADENGNVIIPAQTSSLAKATSRLVVLTFYFE